MKDYDLLLLSPENKILGVAHAGPVFASQLFHNEHFGNAPYEAEMRLVETDIKKSQYCKMESTNFKMCKMHLKACLIL